MKAIRVDQAGGPEVLKLQDVPDPVPGPGEVLVKIHAAGVNPVDTYVREGLYPRKDGFPYTPGFDGAGVVEASGLGAERFQPGSRVYIAGSLTGTYAERALCLESQIYPLAENLSFEQGAAVGIPYATAYQALFSKACLRPGETVLVHGASGGVGLAAVQLARALGASVIGTAGTEEGRRLVKREGAHHVLDHRAPGYLERVMELTEGRGTDAVLEMLANVNLSADLSILAHRGRVVVIGSRGKIEIMPRDLMSRETTVTGILIFAATPRETSEIHAALNAGFEQGTLRPVVARTLALREAPRAHEDVIHAPALGKIVLLP
ncbi:MAG: NADPH:quinone reductase [Candidatus Omnitrophica bacterium]|nr:NADPH:quinone reductase [Candidatus Omnitrophota bacterium]